MELLQYKIKHYGKRLNKRLNSEPTELSDGIDEYGKFNHVMVAQNGEDPVVPVGRGWLNSAPGRLKYHIRYGNVEDSRKFILLKLEKKVIKSKILPDDYQVVFYKVQTQDPYADDERFMQFWVNEEWVEPLTATNYVEDRKRELLKEILEEENKET